MSKTFRLPKGEPLLDIGSYARGGVRADRRLTPAQVEQVRRTVGRVPEAVVKVLPRGSNDLKAAGKHMDYIGRHGDLDLEGDNGERLRGRIGPALLEDWDLDVDVLHFASLSDATTWAEFEHRIGIDIPTMEALHSFLVFLSFGADVAKHSFWYDEALLARLWDIHLELFQKYCGVSTVTVLAALRKTSLTPSESAKRLIHPPFYFLHGRYLRNPCFLRAHCSVANLLAIAIRRYEKDWNDTVGGTLAGAAAVLARLLPTFPRLHVVSCRRIAGGDVDLALYDSISHELLLCEVKTVYDKHRIDSLNRRFEEAKVNIVRAASQLRITADSLASGSLTLNHLFGLTNCAPAQVHLAVLVWIDPIDLTMHTPEEDILSLNFATFLWLVRQAEGNVQALVKSIRELRNIWAVATMRPIDLGQPDLKIELEVQCGLLDSRSQLAGLPLCALTTQTIAQLPTTDDVKRPDDGPPWISYLEDTRHALTESH